MNNKKTIYSVFSGTFYDIPEKDVKILDIGQVPLTKKPSSSCSKCYGRGQIGRDTTNLSYQICKCVRKNIDFDLIKSLLPEPNPS
jgi:hypothetical protein